MAQRYYCPQAMDPMRGWTDLPDLASKSKKEADDNAEAFAKLFGRLCKAVRKPKGWTPEGKEITFRPQTPHRFSLKEQIEEARKAKK